LTASLQPAIHMFAFAYTQIYLAI